MHITMSFADGSPARISSINTALRHFRPSFIHIWELKTFWHERIICEDDVEVGASGRSENRETDSFCHERVRLSSVCPRQTVGAPLELSEAPTETNAHKLTMF